MKSHNRKQINNGMNFLLVDKLSKTKFRCFDCAMFFANKGSKVDVEVGHINKFYSSTKAKSKVGQ